MNAIIKTVLYCSLYVFLGCDNLPKGDGVYKCKFWESKVYIQLENNRSTLYKHRPTHMKVYTRFIDRDNFEIWSPGLYQVKTEGTDLEFVINPKETDLFKNYATVLIRSLTTNNGSFVCEIEIPFGEL